MPGDTSLLSVGSSPVWLRPGQSVVETVVNDTRGLAPDLHSQGILSNLSWGRDSLGSKRTHRYAGIIPFIAYQNLVGWGFLSPLYRDEETEAKNNPAVC